MLERLRGTPQVDAEFEDIQEASRLANQLGLRQVGWGWGWVTAEEWFSVRCEADLGKGMVWRCCSRGRQC